MELCLLRHGRTEPNEKRLYCGAIDPHLSESGRADLLALAEARPLPLFDLVVDTGMHRTIETADILCRGKKRVTWPSLREMDFGSFEAKDYETLRHDPAYIEWITDKTGDRLCPGGESRNGFYTRVQEGFRELLAATDAEHVCIVCHGGTINALMSGFSREVRKFYEWQPDNGHGWITEVLTEDGSLVFSTPLAI